MPALSVVVPTYQRRDSLRACLAALEKQSMPPDGFEVIVVIDGASDGTAEMLAAFDPPFSLRALHQDNAGPGSARNLGARSAAGDFLVFLDDDVIADPGLLDAHANAQSAAEGVVAVGNIVHASQDTDWYIRAYASNWNAQFAQLAARQPDWQDLYSGNVSVPRKLFEDVGGFSTDRALPEDAELGCRLQAAGAVFDFAAAATVVHRNNKSRTVLLREADSQGASAYALCRRSPIALADLAADYHRIGGLPLLALQFGHRAGLPAHWLGGLRCAITDRQAARWQKMIRQYAFWSGFRRAADEDDRDFWPGFATGVTILAYHAFTADETGAGRFIVSARAFEAQMRYLHDEGYRVISVAELAAIRRAGGMPGARTLVLTFDDGYADFADIAWPVMQRYGFGGTLFVVTQKAGSTNGWDEAGELAGRPLLGWRRLAELAVSGVEIGAHSRTHPSLCGLPTPALQTEVSGAGDDIMAKLGNTPSSFAYPFGDYDAAATAALDAAGFQAACTVNPGPNTPEVKPLELRRIEVFGTDGVRRFRTKVRFGARRPRPAQLLRGL